MPDEDQGPWLAADRMPEEGHWQVEVYTQSMFNDAQDYEWKHWGTSYMEPWYIWRYCSEPSKVLRDKSSRKRRELGVKALEGNGFYMRPKEGE